MVFMVFLRLDRCLFMVEVVMNFCLVVLLMLLCLYIVIKSWSEVRLRWWVKLWFGVFMVDFLLMMMSYKFFYFVRVLGIVFYDECFC